MYFTACLSMCACHGTWQNGECAAPTAQLLLWDVTDT